MEKTQEDVVIVAATRTAIGKFGGTLATTPAHILGAQIIKSLLEKSGVQPGQVNEVIMGQVLTAACGQNPARQAALSAELPNSTIAMTLNKVCGSGLKAVQLAAQAIKCGDAEIIIAGGQENMNLAPHAVMNSRTGQRMGDWKMTDTMIKDGLWEASNDYHMGVTAENVAKYIFDELDGRMKDIFGNGLTLVSIKLWETPSSFALYERENDSK